MLINFGFRDWGRRKGTSLKRDGEIQLLGRLRQIGADRQAQETEKLDYRQRQEGERQLGCGQG